MQTTRCIGRCMATAMVTILSLTGLVVLAGPACGAVDTPTVISPEEAAEDVSANPTLESSAYAGHGDAHSATEWQIEDSSGLVWSRLSTSPETQTVVNAANGTFRGSLAGNTGLAANSVYLVNVRYRDDADGWSDWGKSYFATATTSWFLAEGSTDGGMETWVLVQNPGDVEAKVDIRFQTDQGQVPPPALQGLAIAPATRMSINVGLFVTTYNVSTMVTVTRGSVVCERAMYGNGRAWAHESIGVTSPSSQWYLAEGSTDGGMETWVLVQNPNSTAVTVDLAFMTTGGPVAGPVDFSIPAYSRISFDLSRFVIDYSVSTRVTSGGGGVICERAMYGNGRAWAHDSIGTTSAGPAWFFAEGSAAGDMETWVLVQNPSTSSQLIEFWLMGDSGPLGYIPYEVGACSRISLNLRDYEIETYDVSITVATVDSDRNIVEGSIICERAMYNSARTWGHDSIGTPLPASPLWDLAEGCTAGGMETWLLVQNPQNSATTLDISLMTETGIVTPPELQNVNIGAFSRLSFNLGDYVTSYNVSTEVSAESRIVCERSMYGPNHQCAHNSKGCAVAGAWFSITSAVDPSRFTPTDLPELLPRDRR